jgi:hypothetical protein
MAVPVKTRAGVVTPIYLSALRCVERGWSVIPLIGGDDPSPGKIPTVSWTQFQSRLVTKGELHHWLNEKEFSAYGIVCGCLSRLVVLDIDDPTIADEFTSQFPEFAGTLTVRSGIRGTPHFYFEVDFTVKSRKLRGADLKGESGYVVGPGSVIAGRKWEIIRDFPVKRLSREDMACICTFLSGADKFEKTFIHEPTDIESHLQTQTIVDRYKRDVAQTGQRNNTLFDVTRYIRDRGGSREWAFEVLADVHAKQFSLTSTRIESYTQRYREAERTIASAFSRPSRKQAPLANEQQGREQLDNSIREALLQRPDGTAFLRVYEGLRLLGFRAGRSFTYKEAATTLAGIIGDYSVRKALKASSFGGRLFTQNPSPAPPSSANADPEGSLENKAKKCFVPQQKPTKSRKPTHRPPILYGMPSAGELRERLGVTPSGGDTLRLADLHSVKSFRGALEREFIKR